MAKKVLKVAFINIFQGAVERGAEVFVTEVAGRLGKKHKVDVISGSKRLPKRWPVIWRVFIDPNGLLIMIFTLRLIPRMLKERYDVVVPINGGWQVAIVRVVTWLYGGKMVVSGQSGKGWDDRNNLYSFPDCFVALTDYTRNWASGFNPFVRVEKISNGVDVERFSPKGKARDFGLSGPIVLSVGALVSEKCHENVIRAVAKLKNVSLVIVGEGAERDKIERLGKDLIEDRFKIMSAKHKEMPEIYRGADVFVLTQQPTEAFGIAFLEAMATGLTVVARNDQIRREIIGKAGVLVDNPEDAGDLASGIKKALMKGGMSSRSQAEKYDWGLIAQRYGQLFVDLQ